MARRESPKKAKSRQGPQAKKTQKDKSQHDELERLFQQMESDMAMDRILEARKTVDSIEKLLKLNDIVVSQKRQDELVWVIAESNHVLEMLKDLKSPEGWTLASSKRGVTVQYRHVEGSPIHCVKTRAILHDFTPTDFVHMCALFAEIDLAPDWFPRHIMDHVNLLAKPTKYRYVFQMLMKFPIFIISDREIMAEGVGYHLRGPSAFLISSKSIESSPYCSIPKKPPPKTVRMENQTVFYVELLPGNRVMFCQIARDDLKMKYMPSFILNYVAQGVIPFELLESLKKCIRNFKGSKWEARMKERRDFYSEIEQRIQEEIVLVEGKEAASKVEVPLPEIHPGVTRATAIVMMVALVTATRLSMMWYDLHITICLSIVIPPVPILTYLIRLNDLSKKGVMQ